MGNVVSFDDFNCCGARKDGDGEQASAVSGAHSKDGSTKDRSEHGASTLGKEISKRRRNDEKESLLNVNDNHNDPQRKAEEAENEKMMKMMMSENDEDIIKGKKTNEWREEVPKALDQYVVDAGVGDAQGNKKLLYSLSSGIDYFKDDAMIELRSLVDEPMGVAYFKKHLIETTMMESNQMESHQVQESMNKIPGSDERPNNNVTQRSNKTINVTFVDDISNSQNEKEKDEMSTTATAGDHSLSTSVSSELYSRSSTPARAQVSFDERKRHVDYSVLLIAWLAFHKYHRMRNIENRKETAIKLYSRFINKDSSQYKLLPSQVQSAADGVCSHVERALGISSSPITTTSSSSSSSKDTNDEGKPQDGSENTKDKTQLDDQELSTLFLDVQTALFMEMKKLLPDFKHSPYYVEYLHAKEKHYNKVQPDDFLYLNLLGSGGFGQVVHVIKRSTGRHYAMKVQTKKNLLSTWGEKKFELVKVERDALVANNANPFIVSLRYAFQTKAHAFLVLDLAECGSLESLQESIPGRMLDESQVRLYAAEILLALHVLHKINIIHRDIKPANVLLRQDGHVMLADLGLAGYYYHGSKHGISANKYDLENDQAMIDANLHSHTPPSELGHHESKQLYQHALSKAVRRVGSVLGPETGAAFNAGHVPDTDSPLLDTLEYVEDQKEAIDNEKTLGAIERELADQNLLVTKNEEVKEEHDRLVQLVKEKKEDEENQVKEEGRKRLTTHMTDCGTPFFRPPEMVQGKPYGINADFFMLGVMIFELLVGRLPYLPTKIAKQVAREEKNKLVAYSDNENGEVVLDPKDELNAMLHALEMPAFLSLRTKSLLSLLLEPDPEKRIGSKLEDIDVLKKHEFFRLLEGVLATECNWEKVEKKIYQPSYVPQPVKLETKPRFKNFLALQQSLTKAAEKEAVAFAKAHKQDVQQAKKQVADMFLGGTIDEELDHHFENWNFIDSETVRAEREAIINADEIKEPSRRKVGNVLGMLNPFSS